MLENNEVIPEPLGTKVYKGKISLRVSRSKHRELAMRSAEEGVSLNAYISSHI
jgi:predicted HicB family RNase H-like nuclease